MRNSFALSEHLSAAIGVLAISHIELANALGTDRRTVERWLADDTYPQRESRRRLDDLDRLCRRLQETFDGDGPALWLHAPSGYFGTLAPLAALTAGRFDALNSALDAFDQGVFV